MHLINKVNGIIIGTPQYNECLSPLIKNVLDWVTLIPGSNVLEKKKIGLVGASFINESAITDVKTVCQVSGANVFDQLFHINLKAKAFDQTAGTLQSAEYIDKLSLWYQDFGNFIISGKEYPEPIPRFIY